MILERYNMQNKYFRVTIWGWREIFPTTHLTHCPGQRGHPGVEDAMVRMSVTDRIVTRGSQTLNFAVEFSLLFRHKNVNLLLSILLK